MFYRTRIEKDYLDKAAAQGMKVKRIATQIPLSVEPCHISQNCYLEQYTMNLRTDSVDEGPDKSRSHLEPERKEVLVECLA